MRYHREGPFAKKTGEVGAEWTLDDIEQIRANMAAMKEQSPDSQEATRKLRRLKKRQQAGKAPTIPLDEALKRISEPPPKT